MPMQTYSAKKSALILAIVFALGDAWAEEKKAYPDLSGSRSDSNGSIEWLSQGVGEAGTWTYSYLVKNTGKINCRISWDAVGLLSTLTPTSPSDVARGSVKGPDELRQVNGKIKYNGGTAAGEGIADAPAWVANDRKQAKCTATASIIVDRRNFLFPIEITAESEPRFDENSKSFKITYDFKISPAKAGPNQNANFDMKEFQSTVAVTWQAVASPVWTKKEGVLFERGAVRESGELLFHRDDVEHSLSVKGLVSTGSEAKPKIQIQPVNFAIFGPDGTETVVAKAMIPAYSPSATGE